MRWLLVDNHGSFTANLAHLIHRVTGAMPLVVGNHDLDLTAIGRLDVGAIVLSPGPGRPDRPADVGVGLALAAESALPLLGVCLGHQSLGVASGARCVRAPAPVHGLASIVEHDGGPLWDGIPRRFAAMRYHALVLEAPLPESLVCTARTDDGLVMAIRHRERARFGVQFHPESIGAEHGERLLANFARLAGLSVRSPVPVSVSVPVPVPVPVPAPAPAPRYTLRVRRLPAAPAAEDAFVALYGDAGPGSFWLDSSRPAASARFSFMGDASGPLAARLRYDADAGVLAIREADGRERRVVGALHPSLAAELAAVRVAAPPPLALVGGVVGCFGFEGDAELVRPDRVVAFDHATGDATLAALALAADAASIADADRWLAVTADRLAAVGPAPPPRRPPRPVALDVRFARPPATYLADIAACLEEIAAGETYEVCLTNQLVVRAQGGAPLAIDPLAIHRALRRSNPAPYAGFLRFDAAALVCSSPERFLHVDPHGVVETRPIKGTAPRGRTAAEDAALARALADDPRTRAENLIVVDLLRNDLGTVALPGSVHVTALLAVEPFETVHQLVTTVRAQLPPGQGAATALAACFPGGSMTGAPKPRTLAILRRLEGAPRGRYAGALGWLGADGSGDLAIVIRTAVVEPDRITIGTGGGITALSGPADELAEIALKLRAPLGAVLAAAGDPEADRTVAGLERGWLDGSGV